MLSEKAQRLLTAAVDGELDYLERRALKRLLRESEEAQVFLRDLQSDARRLRRLTRPALALQFSDDVLHALGQRPAIVPANIASRSSRTSRRIPTFVSIAVASALFLMIAAGSYVVILWYDSESTAVVRNQPGLPLAPEPISAPGLWKPAPVVQNDLARENDEPRPEQLAVAPLELIAPPRLAMNEPPSIDAAPLTSLFTPRGEPATVEPLGLPPPLAVRDLDQLHNRQRLLEALRKDDTIQLDLFCRDSSKAVEQVVTVLRGQGVRTFVDGVAQDRLNRKLKTCYALYIDSATPEEVVKFARTLAAEERKAEVRQNAQLEKLVTLRFSPESYKALGVLLGIEPKWLRDKPKPAADPLKPLTDGTTEKLAQKLAEKTGSATPPAKQPVEHNALIVACDPPRPNPAASREISLFLSARKDRRPGSVAILLVVR